MKMCHVTIHVSDMEASIKFYEEVLGIAIQGDLRPMGAPIVFLGESKEDVKVELIADPEKAYKGSGISVGFTSADLDADYARMQALGYPVTPMIFPNPHTKFFFVTDPDGLQVQLI